MNKDVTQLEKELRILQVLKEEQQNLKTELYAENIRLIQVLQEMDPHKFKHLKDAVNSKRVAMLLSSLMSLT